jgi:hypothetical protein
VQDGVCRTWCPGHGVQDMSAGQGVQKVVCRTWCAGRGVQDKVCRTRCAGQGVQDVVCRTRNRGRGCRGQDVQNVEDHVWRIKGQCWEDRMLCFQLGRILSFFFLEEDEVVNDDAGVLLEPALLLLPGHLLLLPPLGPQPARSSSLLQQDPKERKPKLSFILVYFISYSS